jgi:hypothetical protein
VYSLTHYPDGTLATTQTGAAITVKLELLVGPDPVSTTVYVTILVTAVVVNGGLELRVHIDTHANDADLVKNFFLLNAAAFTVAPFIPGLGAFAVLAPAIFLLPAIAGSAIGASTFAPGDLSMCRADGRDMVCTFSDVGAYLGTSIGKVELLGITVTSNGGIPDLNRGYHQGLMLHGQLLENTTAPALTTKVRAFAGGMRRGCGSGNTPWVAEIDVTNSGTAPLRIVVSPGVFDDPDGRYTLYAPLGMELLPGKTFTYQVVAQPFASDDPSAYPAKVFLMSTGGARSISIDPPFRPSAVVEARIAALRRELLDKLCRVPIRDLFEHGRYELPFPSDRPGEPGIGDVWGYRVTVSGLPAHTVLVLEDAHGKRVAEALGSARVATVEATVPARTTLALRMESSGGAPRLLEVLQEGRSISVQTFTMTPVSTLRFEEPVSRVDLQPYRGTLHLVATTEDRVHTFALHDPTRPTALHLDEPLHLVAERPHRPWVEVGSYRAQLAPDRRTVTLALKYITPSFIRFPTDEAALPADRGSGAIKAGAFVDASAES